MENILFQQSWSKSEYHYAKDKQKGFKFKKVCLPCNIPNSHSTMISVMTQF